jgi:hyperosmotically inducible protein
MNTFSRIAASALFAVAVAGCASVGGYADDAWITSKVSSTMAAKSPSTWKDVNVETKGGVVQLAGFAKNRAEADEAVAMAKSVSGVKQVINNIVIKP